MYCQIIKIILFSCQKYFFYKIKLVVTISIPILESLRRNFLLKLGLLLRKFLQLRLLSGLQLWGFWQCFSARNRTVPWMQVTVWPKNVHCNALFSVLPLKCRNYRSIKGSLSQFHYHGRGLHQVHEWTSKNHHLTIFFSKKIRYLVSASWCSSEIWQPCSFVCRPIITKTKTATPDIPSCQSPQQSEKQPPSAENSNAENANATIGTNARSE